MGFVDVLKETLGDEFNHQRTENGALGYRQTDHPLLDANFAASSFRNMSGLDVINKVKKAYVTDKVLFMQWLFYLRDAREGLGERRAFRNIMRWLACCDPEIIAKVMPLIVEYGRWDDLFAFIKTPCEKQMLSLIEHQLQQDIWAACEGKPISLLAKWMPSENASSPKTKELAGYLFKNMERSWTRKQYRKILSTLREHLKVVERQTSANKWDEIEYQAVPSKANLLYRNAFLRHDEARRREFLEKLTKGEAKINASVLFPHDIVSSYRGNYSIYSDQRMKEYGESLEALWKALPNTVNDAESVIVVADGSGSMLASVGNTNVTALDVANSLAIYFAERCAGEFKNKYITFSHNPQLVDLQPNKENTSLRSKLQIAYFHCEIANTDVAKVFELILVTALRESMTQDELPKTVLIISDMEFDQGADMNVRLFQEIADKFKQHGYVLPKLVFWNVCSRTQTIPLKSNDKGVILVSGFSPNVVKMVMSNKTDPYEALLETLNSERYQQIREILAPMRIS